jgi:hypothetical protein
VSNCHSAIRRSFRSALRAASPPLREGRGC